MKVVCVILMAWVTAIAFAQPSEVVGRVIDERGSSVPNAVVTTRAVTRTTGTLYGINEGVDREVRSDAEGKFRIKSQNPFISATVTVEAPGFAKGVFSQLAADGKPHELKMQEGVSIIGVVAKNGQPLSSIRVGLSDAERGSEIFSLNVTAETDAKGRFRFANIPAKRDYFLYGVMDSLLNHGALRSRRITTATNASVLDVGTFEIGPAFTLEGAIRPAIAGALVTLGRDGPHDIQQTQTDTEGRFRFRGVPEAVVSIAAQIPGKRLSIKNGSLFPPNPVMLLGRMHTNVTGLILDFETGETLPPLNANPYALREEPLRGAEPSRPVPDGIAVGGNVFDDQTKKPIANFWVMEGRGRSPRDWFPMRTVEFTNGAFIVHFASRGEPAAIQIGADDYLPIVRGQISETETNLVFHMKRGITPRGRVLHPDGSPANGAEVHLGAIHPPIHIQGPPLEVAAYSAARKTTTDPDGKFSFAPLAGDSYLVVVHESGYAQLDLEALQKSRDITLQSWARVEGRLKIGSHPAPNEVVFLSSMPAPYEWYPRELPPVSISLRTRTDTNGHFAFERVPPMPMEIAHSPQFRQDAPELNERTQTRRLQLQPGETMRVDLGGKGRALFGQVIIEGFEGEILWNLPAVMMETIPSSKIPSGLSLTNFLARIQATAVTNQVAKEKAENEYQIAREELAEAARKFYTADEGKAALNESRRYLLYVNEDGLFRGEDIPAGKYIIHWKFFSKADPMPAAFMRPVAQMDSEIVVPDGTEPLDLGVFRVRAVERKR